jgi:Flp pilus assembly protein TadB
MFGKLFKPRAHYVFDYKPRYYDERKERIKQLEKKYSKSNTSDEEVNEIKLTKNNLKNNWVKQKQTSADKATILRMAIIIAILVGIVAYLFDLHTLF